VFLAYFLFFYSLERLVQRLNKTRVFAFNKAPFFVFLSPKMEVRLIFDSKKAISNFKRALLDNGQDAPETASRRGCHCVGT
jgi:hypothetical protein